MAIRQEIFSADVQISFVGEKDALDKLSKLVKGSSLEIPWRFADIGKSQLASLQKSLDKQAPLKIKAEIQYDSKGAPAPSRSSSATKSAPSSRGPSVSSPIGQIEEFDKLQAQLSTLSRTGDATAIALKRSFAEIRADSRKGLLDETQTKEALSNLSNAVDEYKQSLAAAGVTKAAQEAVELRLEFESLNETVKRSKNAYLGVADPIRTVSTSTVSLVDRGSGLSKIFDRNQSSLQGFREVLSGSSASTNFFIKGIDLMVKRNNALAAGLTRNQRLLARQAADLDGSTILLQKQARVLGELAKQKGFDTTEIKEYQAQLRRVQLAISQVNVTASKGGDTTDALARQRAEVSKLVLQYNQLEAAGAIPEELTEEFARLARATGDIDAKTRSLVSSSQAVRREQEQLKEQEKERKKVNKDLGDTAEKTNRSILGIFKRGKVEVRDYNVEVKKTDSALDQAARGLKQFQVESKNAFKVEALAEFAGSLGANIVGKGIDFIATKIKEIPLALIQAGSDAEESQSKFEAVFGEFSGPATQALDTYSEAIGRSKFALREQASAFQDTLVPLGATQEEASRLSVATVKLTQDLASFNNEDPSETLRSIQGALVGNTENLRKYGVVANQAAIDQELLKLGIEGGTAAASPYEKSLAILNIAISQNAAAMGDAERTAGSFANQQRKLTGQFEDFSIQVGIGLKDALAPFLRLANVIAERTLPVLLSGFEKVTAVIQPFADGLALAFETGDFGPLIDSFDPFVDGILSLVSQSFDWGFGLVENIADGILDAADSILDSALTYVGDLWSSFLEPGSPPEQGPLSSMDKWASGLLDVFMAGAEPVDASFLVDALEPVQEALRGLEVDDATLAKAQNLILSINDTLSSTGQVNSEAFGQLDQLLGQDNKALSNYLRGTAQVEASTKDIANLQRQVSLARARGEDDTDLRAKIKAARLQQKSAQSIADSNKKIYDLQQRQSKSSGSSSGGGSSASDETIQTELDAVQERLDLGLIAEEDAQRDRLRIYQKYAEEARKAGDKETARQLADQAKLIEKSLEKEAKVSEAASEKTLDEELATIKQRADLGLITEEQAQQERIRLLRQYAEKAREENNLGVAKDLASQANAIEKALEDQRLAEQEAKKKSAEEKKALDKADREARKAAEKKTAEEIYQEELSQLQAKIDAGIISEEDAARERLKIEKKLFDSVTEEGRSASADNIANIKKFQGVVESFKEKNKGDILGLGDGSRIDADKIIGQYEGLVGDKAQELGNKVADRVVRGVDEFKEKVFSKFGEIIAKVKEKLDDPKVLNLILGFKSFLDIFNRVKGIITGESIFAKLLAPITPFMKIIDTIAAPVLRAGRAIGIFLDHFGVGGKILKKFLGFALNLTGPLGILLNIWLNWDTIVLAFNTTVQALNDIWKGFTDRLGGSETALQKLSDFWTNLTTLFDTAKEKLGGFFSALLDGDFSGAFAALSFEDFDFTTITTLGSEIATALWDSVTEVASGLFTQLGEYILGLLPADISEKIQEKFQFVTDLQTKFSEFTSFISGDFSPVFDTIQAKFTELSDQAGPKLTELGTSLSEAWDKLKEAFSRVGVIFEEKLGPALSKLAIALGFADEGGGDLNVTLSSVADFLIGAGLDLLINKIVSAIEGFTTIVDYTVIAIDFLLPILETLGTAWSFLIDGIATKIEGFQETIDFFVGLFQGAYDLLLGNSIIPDMVLGFEEWFAKLLIKPLEYALALKDTFVGYVTDMSTGATDIASGFYQIGSDLVNNLWDGVESIWSSFSTYFDDQITSLTTRFTNFTSGLTFPDFSGGFSVPGFATGAWELPKDTLAMVHKGEMIVPAGAAEALRGMLTNINLAGIGDINLSVGPGISTQTSSDSTTGDTYEISIPVTVYGSVDANTGRKIGSDAADSLTSRLRAKGRS